MEQMDQWRRRYFRGLLYFLLFGLALFGLGKLSDSRFHSKAFSGRIEKIEFSSKGIIMIFIHGQDFYLNNYDRSIKDYLDVGDSVNKPENTWDISIYKMKGDSVISTFVWPPK